MADYVLADYMQADYVQADYVQGEDDLPRPLLVRLHDLPGLVPSAPQVQGWGGASQPGLILSPLQILFAAAEDPFVAEIRCLEAEDHIIAEIRCLEAEAAHLKSRYIPRKHQVH